MHPSKDTLAVLFAASLTWSLFATRPAALAAQVTESDYARAEQFLGWNARNFVSGDQAQPTFFEGATSDRFWYSSRMGAGSEFVLIDPTAPGRRLAFDHDRLAAALSIAADTSYEGRKLPFETFEFVEGGQSIQFHTSDSARWTCSIASYACMGPEPIPDGPRTEIRSPDGRWVAYHRDENLWIRSTGDGEEIQLSTDGTPDFGYAAPPEGCCSAVTLARQDTEAPPLLRWSPDSRKIATHRLDESAVEQLHLLEAKTGRPVLHSYRVGLPGDSVIPTYELHVFDVETRTGVQVDIGTLEAVNTSCCQLAADTVWKDVKWGESSEEVFFTRGVRSFDTLQLIAADAETGTVRTIITETSKTFVESNGARSGLPNWRVTSDGSEAVWWSERDGWGHLYLYDATTGALKNRITEGPWLVVDLLEVDDVGRWAYFTAQGREEGLDPYFRQLYRASLDGGRVERLTPEDADHEIRAAPSGRFFTDTYSTYNTEPMSVLRNATGRVVATLEEGDFSDLLATGWHFPTHFVVKARDGVTDLHGLLFFPSDFDSAAVYPVVDYIYPGPQVGALGTRQVTTSPRGNAAALAELGFIVFMIDAMGSPGRSKAFHDAFYGNMHDNGLPDHVTAIKQLASRYPQMDLDRVGIFGHSGGGFGSTDAMLSYPDFFKVAVSTAGNHDNRSYDYTWGEKYQGLVTQNPDGTDSFDSQANQNYASNLKGKLLLMYGTLDDNVHPNATLMVVDELIKAGKDFDMIVYPNGNHGFGGQPYVIRRTWDYFVEHLRGEDPPREYPLKRPGE